MKKFLKKLTVTGFAFAFSLIFATAAAFILPSVQKTEVAAADETTEFSEFEDYYRLIYSSQLGLGEVADARNKLNSSSEFSLDITFDSLSRAGILGTAMLVCSKVFEKNPASILFTAVKFISTTSTISMTNKNIKSMIEDSTKFLGEKLDGIYDSLYAKLDEQKTYFDAVTSNITNYTDIQNYKDALLEFAYDKKSTGVFGSGNDDGFGFGFYGWQKRLYFYYTQLANTVSDSNATQAEIHAAYNGLYRIASYASVLENYMTDTEKFDGHSIQEIIYRYYLLKSEGRDFEQYSEECILFAQNLYETYYMAQAYLELCRAYQGNWVMQQYNTEDETQLKSKYYLFDPDQSVTAINNSLPYTLIKEQAENCASRIEKMSASIAAYYARILNLNETYEYKCAAFDESYAINYEEALTSKQYGSTQIIIKKDGVSAVSTPHYYRKNNAVTGGDSLYVNTLPDKLTAAYPGTFTFESSNSSVASVTDDGIVSVKGNTGANFTLTLYYNGVSGEEKYPVYSMDFVVGEGNEFVGKGIKQMPYLIRTSDELNRFMSNSAYHQAGVYVRMTDNIDGSQIGTSIGNYYGEFDGNGYTISGMIIVFASDNYGTIKNVKFSNTSCYYTRSTYGASNVLVMGGIAANNQADGVIENCVFENSSIGTEFRTAVLNGDSAYLSTYAYVGGIAGKNYGKIKGCTVKNSQITSYTNEAYWMEQGKLYNSDPYGYAGGLVAYSGESGEVSDCLLASTTVTCKIRNSGYYWKVLWSGSEYYSNAYIYSGGLAAESKGGSFTRCIVNNVSIQTFNEKVAAQGSNDENKAKDNARVSCIAGSAYIASNNGTAVTNCIQNSASISSDAKELFRENGWEFDSSNNPYRTDGGLVITSRPIKCVYNLGEKFNGAGLIVKKTDGTLITGYTVSGFNSSSLGTKKLTISYDKYSVNLDVEVVCRHNVELVSGRESTCTVKGYSDSTHCTVCGEVFIASEELDYAPHTFEEHEGKAPTCISIGWEDYGICTECGYSTYKEIPASGHAVVIEDAVEATCTHTGLTEGSYCALCNEIFVEQQVIPAKGHTEVVDAYVAPTCAHTGLTEGSHCSVCNEVLVPQQELNTLPHSNVIYDAKEATCTEIGWNRHETCSVCGYSTKVEIPAKGHTLTAHEGKAATCTEGGWEDYETCSVCGYSSYSAIPAKGHSAVTDAYVAPTCLNTGLTEGSHCSVCNLVLTAQTQLPAKGHTLVKVAAKAPTCTEVGWEEHKRCTDCDFTTKTEITAKGHSPIQVSGYAATCTVNGLTDGTSCSVCGTAIIAQQIIPASGHTSGLWITDVEATESHTGHRYTACTVCGAIVNQEEIPKLSSGCAGSLDLTLGSVFGGAGVTLFIAVRILFRRRED